MTALLALDFSRIQNQAFPDFNFDLESEGIGSIVAALLPYLFAAAGIILLLFLIISGLQLIISGGEPKAVESAKAKITNAFMGFVVVFVAYWLVQIIAKVFGIQSILDIFQ